MQLHLSKRLNAGSLLAYAADLRWQAESAGIEVNGLAVATDRTSQAMIANVRAYLDAAPSGATIAFKTSSGFRELSAEQFAPIAGAVAAHVQACFALESAVAAEIIADPPTIFTLSHVDQAFA